MNNRIPPIAKVIKGIFKAITSILEIQNVSDQARSEGFTTISIFDSIEGSNSDDCQPITIELEIYKNK